MITINNIQEDSIDILKDDHCIGTCKSSISFDDLRVQIKENKASGYFFMFNNKRYDIQPDGRIYPEYPRDLYREVTDLLTKLVLE
jgi:hypothetical protein